MSGDVYNLSKQLGSVSRDQFNRALARFGLGELRYASAVPFGLFGQNAFVTSTRGEFVFRGAPLVHWQFPTERFYASLLHDHGVPAPWPYLIDDSCEFFPWAYVIMPRMPGVQASDPAERQRLSASDRIELAHALARMLATLHEITMPKLARFDAERDCLRSVPLRDWMAWPSIEKYGEMIGAEPRHDEIVSGRIRTLLAKSQSASDITTTADVEWAEQILAQSESALRVPFRPSLVFEDYKEGNVVFRRVLDLWEVCGVFDLMQCFFGDGEADLARPAVIYFDESPALAEAFLLTYLELKPPRPGFVERARVYMLLDRLIIWEYVVRQEPRIAQKVGSLRHWMERYVELVPTFAQRV